MLDLDNQATSPVSSEGTTIKIEPIVDAWIAVPSDDKGNALVLVEKPIHEVISEFESEEELVDDEIVLDDGSEHEHGTEAAVHNDAEISVDDDENGDGDNNNNGDELAADVDSRCNALDDTHNEDVRSEAEPDDDQLVDENAAELHREQQLMPALHETESQTQFQEAYGAQLRRQDEEKHEGRVDMDVAASTSAHVVSEPINDKQANEAAEAADPAHKQSLL